MAVRDKQLRGRRACVNAMCTQLTFVHVLLVFYLKGGNPLWQMFQLNAPQLARQLLPTLRLLASVPSHSLHASSPLPTHASFSMAFRLLRRLLLSSSRPSMAELFKLSRAFKSLKQVTLSAQPPSALMEVSGLPWRLRSRHYSEARVWLTSPVAE